MDIEKQMHADYVPITEFSPATFHQFVSLLLERMAGESLPELAGIVRLRGRLTDPGSPSGKIYYGVKIADDGGSQAKADIPVSLIAGRGVKAGQQVIVTGRVGIRSTQYGVEARVAVTDLELGKTEVAVSSESADQGRMTIERLRTMQVVRNNFPVSETITVALIQSSSAHAQVALDCRTELDKLGDILVINPIPINMIDPVAIAMAIRQADADILMLIRGGGDSRDFEVFDDPRVVQAMVECTAFRVVGLGHTGNGTLLDIIGADYSANTPGQAGMYVRERIEARLRKQKEAQGRWNAMQARVTELEQARVEKKRLVPLWWVAVAFAIGVIAVRFI